MLVVWLYPEDAFLQLYAKSGSFGERWGRLLLRFGILERKNGGGRARGKGQRSEGGGLEDAEAALDSQKAAKLEGQGGIFEGLKEWSLLFSFFSSICHFCYLSWPFILFSPFYVSMAWAVGGWY